MGSDSETVRPSWSTRRVAALVIGTGCLAACIVAASVRGVSIPKEEGMTARMLLDGPEMADVATTNLMHSGIARADQKGALHASVAAGLHKFTHDLEEEDDEVYERLDSMVLTQEQKAHILQKVASLSDPRMQQLGEEIAQIASDHKNDGPEAVARVLAEKFGARLPELRKTRDELMPNAKHMRKQLTQMRLLHGMPKERRLGFKWTDSSGNACRRRSCDVSSSSSEEATGIVSEKGEKKTMLGLQDTAAVVAGLLEQARVVLDQTDFIGEAFGADLKISPFTKSAVGGADFLAECGECVMRSMKNPVKLMMCPMKYASAAADMMECIDNMMGFSNDKFAMNGGAAAASAQQPYQAAGAWGQAAATPTASPHQTNAFQGGWTR